MIRQIALIASKKAIVFALTLCKTESGFSTGGSEVLQCAPIRYLWGPFLERHAQVNVRTDGEDCYSCVNIGTSQRYRMDDVRRVKIANRQEVIEAFQSGLAFRGDRMS